MGPPWYDISVRETWKRLPLLHVEECATTGGAAQYDHAPYCHHATTMVSLLPAVVMSSSSSGDWLAMRFPELMLSRDLDGIIHISHLKCESRSFIAAVTLIIAK